MVKIVNEMSNYESEVKPLLWAAESKSWKNVLKILLINHSMLTVNADFNRLILVSTEGSESKSKETIELINSRSLVELKSLLNEISKQFLPLFITKISAAVGAMEVDQDEETQKAIFVAQIIGNFSDIQDKVDKLGMPVIVEGIKPFIEFLSVSITRKLLEVRTRQQLVMGNEYEEVIRRLHSLGIVKPMLKISFCPQCINYELTFSEFPSKQAQCPRCGEDWFYVTMYIFKETYQEIKKDNKDLPLFISAYLKSKITMPVQIYPNALLENNSSKHEIDVYIPDTATGIECKTYENPLMATEDKLYSISGKLMEQIEGYKLVGIKKMILITNYSKSATEKLQSILQTNINDIELKIIPGEIDEILKSIDIEAKLAEEIKNNEFKRLMPALETKDEDRGVSD